MSLFTIGEGFIVAMATRQAISPSSTSWGISRARARTTCSCASLPVMAPTLLLLMFRDTIFSFQANFVPALIVTGGGPAPYAIHVSPLLIYRNGFEYLRYGYGGGDDADDVRRDRADRLSAVQNREALATRLRCLICGDSWSRSVSAPVVPTAGCGGGETLGKEQYASRLNAMCADFAEREKGIGEPQSLADLVEKGPRILVAFDEAILDEVRKLKASDEIADQADRLADVAGEQHDVLSELIDAANADDSGKCRSSPRGTRPNTESTSIAQELACADVR